MRLRGQFKFQPITTRDSQGSGTCKDFTFNQPKIFCVHSLNRTRFQMNPADVDVQLDMPYTSGKSISLLSRSRRPDDQLNVVIIESIHVGDHIRSQTVIVRVLDWNDDTKNTKLFAKFFDFSYYTPGESEFEGSAREYMEWLHRNEVESYKRMEKLQGISVPRFIGDYKYMKENGEFVDLILLDNVSVPRLDTFHNLPENEIEILGVQCMNAVDQIHSCGIIHNDIGGRNVFWDRDKQRVLICDFASARRFDEFLGGEKVLDYYKIRDRMWMQCAVKRIQGGIPKNGGADC